MPFIDLTESELVDDSYTLSYHPQTKYWISFHDYIPDSIFCLRNKRLISIKDKKLYTHHTGEYGKFYGLVYQSVLSPVFKLSSLVNFALQSIQFKVDYYKNNQLLDKTVDYIQFSNDRQTTDIIELKHEIPNCSVIENWRLLNTTRIGDYWTFNKIQDTQKSLLLGNYVLIKFIENNLSNDQMRFNDVGIAAIQQKL